MHRVPNLTENLTLHTFIERDTEIYLRHHLMPFKKEKLTFDFLREGKMISIQIYKGEHFYVGIWMHDSFNFHLVCRASMYIRHVFINGKQFSISVAVLVDGFLVTGT